MQWGNSAYCNITWHGHMNCFWLVHQNSELLHHQAPKIARRVPDPFSLTEGGVQEQTIFEYKCTSLLGAACWQAHIHFLWNHVCMRLITCMVCKIGPIPESGRYTSMEDIILMAVSLCGMLIQWQGQSTSSQHVNVETLHFNWCSTHLQGEESYCWTML